MKTNVNIKTALTIAYQAVMRIGYTHQRLVEENFGVNYPTLRRIQSGKPGRPGTDRFYLTLFVTLLKREYDRLMANADTAGTRTILKTLSSILYADLSIPF